MKRSNPIRVFGGVMVRSIRYFTNRYRCWVWSRRGVTINGNVYIHRSCRIEGSHNIYIESETTLDSAYLYALGKIKIGKRVIIGRDVFLCTASHNIWDDHFPLVTRPIIIGDDVWIATGAVILPGVTIGKAAVIGAYSVVSTDIPEGAVVAGNPARIVKTGRKPPANFSPIQLQNLNPAERLKQFLKDS